MFYKKYPKSVKYVQYSFFVTTSRLFYWFTAWKGGAETIIFMYPLRNLIEVSLRTPCELSNVEQTILIHEALNR